MVVVVGGMVVVVVSRYSILTGIGGLKLRASTLSVCIDSDVSGVASAFNTTDPTARPKAALARNKTRPSSFSGIHLLLSYDCYEQSFRCLLVFTYAIMIRSALVQWYEQTLKHAFITGADTSATLPGLS